jgi:hypothetical protein
VGAVPVERAEAGRFSCWWELLTGDYCDQQWEPWCFWILDTSIWTQWKRTLYFGGRVIFMKERSVPFMAGLAVTRNSVVSIYSESAASKHRGMKWLFGHLQILSEHHCRVSLQVHVGNCSLGVTQFR